MTHNATAGGYDVCKNQKSPPFVGHFTSRNVPKKYCSAAKLHCKNIKFLQLLHAGNCSRSRKVLQKHRERLDLFNSQGGTMRKFSNFQTITLHLF